MAIVMQAKEEGKEAAEPVEPVTRTVSKSSEEWQVQNDSKPLWTRSPREVRLICHLPPTICHPPPTMCHLPSAYLACCLYHVYHAHTLYRLDSKRLGRLLVATLTLSQIP